MRRMRARFECFGKEGLRGGRRGLSRRRRISDETMEEICRLKRESYADFSIRHFHEFLTERHGIAASYTFVRDLLQLRGLADKVRGRGRYLRKRERRPMPGMLLHLDASTHTWIEGLPQQDLVVMLDDADGRILYARFFEQEGTASTLAALYAVLTRFGRFCQLYTDRGSHFCRTDQAGAAPADEQNGQVTRVLRTLGIEHILARTPEARGRSPLKLIRHPTGGACLRNSASTASAAAKPRTASWTTPSSPTSIADLAVAAPRERGNAFTSLGRLDLRLLVSARHERIVQKDNTVVFERLFLQLPPSPDRIHYARCPVPCTQAGERRRSTSGHHELLMVRTSQSASDSAPRCKASAR